jgi:hypothetical protein
MKKTIIEIKKKTDTLKILALSYSWAIVACSLIYLLAEDFTSFVGILIRAILFLTFIYGKNNWRILILILSAIGTISAISSIDNIFYLLDVAGNVVVFLYALKERKN